MSLPGVTLNVLNGQLGFIPNSTAQQIIYLGCSTTGEENVLTFYGDQSAMASALGYGELLEAAAYELSVSGGPVGVMTLPPSVRGGLSTVTHSGTGAGTMTVSAAPPAQILITCTTSGALGTAAFTFKIGSGATSAPVTSAAGWSSTGYRVPGTYTLLVFTSGSYVGTGTVDTYIVSTLGAVTHPTGAGPAVPTQTSSPIDWYTPVVTITTAGALETSQFTYSLDGTTANVSGSILTTAAGTYAIPGSGIVLTMSGTMVAGDTYSLTTAGPYYSNSELVVALGLLQSTYLSSPYSMACIVGNISSNANWVTQSSSLETSALSLFGSNVFVRYLNGAPTVGTITGNAGSVTVNSASTDATLLTSRLSVAAPHVGASAGDMLLTSPITGLSQRRNASWAAAGRCASVEASQNIGAVADGAVAGVTYLYRNETITPALDAVGFITMRSWPGSVSSGTGRAGFYITNGHTMDTVVSDYYPLTNARVIDLGCGIAYAAALEFVNSKIPTTTRNGSVGVITERKAQQIENVVEGKLLDALVNTQPQEAVAVNVTVSRTNNVLSTKQLILTVGIQPYAYAEMVYANIGLVANAG